MKSAPLLVALGLALGACAPEADAPAPEARRQSVVELLGPTDTAGYARALEPRDFVFPDDHGPHPDFRTEWWYFTGNLGSADGRRFGYQATFFRSALSPDERPEDAPRTSAWATRQAWMAHFAVTEAGDAGGGRFRSFERFSRGALGLAGARAAPFRVWLEDWEAAAVEGSGGVPPFRLRLADAGAAIDLVLGPGKPPVFHGERGLSRKGAEAGNASYYYSFTRLPTAGRIEIDGRAFEVEGASWIDREWSTSVLEEGQVGWDWLSLQLDDGRDLMVFRLRRSDGRPDPYAGGTLVAPDGASRHLGPDAFRLDALATWTSPETGAVYPARWRLELPGEALDLAIEPILADQELSGSIVYWEGAVEVEGTRAGEPIAGRGYVELTGYGS